MGICAYIYINRDRETDRKRSPSICPNLLIHLYHHLIFLLTAFDRVDSSLILQTLSPPICWDSALWTLATASQPFAPALSDS